MINLSTFKSGFHNAVADSGSAANTVYKHMAWGAGIGAGLGAVNGAVSYDGSLMGGAFNGAIMGGIGGTAVKFGTTLYGHAGANNTEKLASAGGMSGLATSIFGSTK